MSRGLVIFLIVASFIAFAVLMVGCSAVGAYNNLVSSDENVSQNWAQVLNQYQRRFDLVPNLVSIVQGYAKHEQKVFIEVSQARASVGQMKLDPNNIPNAAQWKKFSEAQSGLSSVLSRLMVVTENYPQLKANEGFLKLQDQLESTENRISVERKRFIESVQDYNVSVRSFPNSVVASFTGFKTKPQYESESGDAARVAPKVQF